MKGPLRLPLPPPNIAAKWFAWYPISTYVSATDHRYRWVWLEWVWAERDSNAMGEGFWRYYEQEPK